MTTKNGQIAKENIKQIMEEIIKKLRDYTKVIKLLDGEDGRHYLIEKTLVNFLLVKYDMDDDLSKKALIEIDNHL